MKSNRSDDPPSSSHPSSSHHTGNLFSPEKLQSELLSVEIIPKLGARISSMQVHGGREWMWAPSADRKLFQSPPEGDFLESCLVGADECLPTILACEWQGRSYPGHGECWNAEWRSESRASPSAPVKTSVTLPKSGAHFQRTASLSGNSLLLEYEATNEGDSDWDFSYAFHPLFTLCKGDRVELPIREGGRLYVEDWDGQEAVWPDLKSDADLSRFDMGTTGAKSLKVFSADPLLSPCARVYNSHSGERLTMSFDPAFFTAIGFYLNVGGWGGYHHFAIEPTNAQADSLARGVERGLQFSTLPPGESRSWWIRIAVEAGSDRN